MKTDNKIVREHFIEAFYSLVGSREVKTKTEFSKNVGLTNCSNFKQIEDGIRMPNLEHLCNLISKYDISPNWLFFKIGKMKNK